MIGAVTSGDSIQPKTDTRLSDAMDELQTLSAAQQKILKRAAEWEARLIVAKRELPGDIPLIVFRDVEEISELLPSMIRTSIESMS